MKKKMQNYNLPEAGASNSKHRLCMPKKICFLAPKRNSFSAFLTCLN